MLSRKLLLIFLSEVRQNKNNFADSSQMRNLQDFNGFHSHSGVSYILQLPYLFHFKFALISRKKLIQKLPASVAKPKIAQIPSIFYPNQPLLEFTRKRTSTKD